MVTRLLVLAAGPADQRWVQAFTQDGFELTVTSSLPAAVRAALSSAPNIILALLDGAEAAQTCSVLCALDAAPVVMGGAGWSDGDTAACLDAGADATLALPLPAPEAGARLRAVARRVRRSAQEAARARITAGPLVLDLNARVGWWHGRAVNLTPTEFNILAVLGEHPGRVVSSRELLTRVWGEEYADDFHYVRLYISYLREKLEEDPHNPRVIVNRWGLGYCLSVNATGDAALAVVAGEDSVPVSRITPLPVS